MDILNQDTFDSVKNRMKDKFSILLSCYLEDGQKYLDLIQSGLNDGDLKMIIENAHTLKSASGILGAIQVQKNAETLEYAGKDLLKAEHNDLKDLPPLYDTLKKSFEETRETIRSITAV